MKTKTIFLYSCLALASITTKAQDSLEVRIKLKTVDDVLTFNQTYVPDNYQEYAWTVLIDSDNDPLTGNTGAGYGGNTGFDVALSISNFKLTGSTAQTGSIVSAYTRKKTVILNGTQGTAANDITAFIDYSDSTLVMRGSKAFPELVNVAVGNRYFVYTYYYLQSGIPATDVSSIATISNAISDATDDVNYSFMDIKGATINLGTVGILESFDNDASFTVFPNPSSGIFKIESGNVKNASLNVFNHLGEKVLQQQIDDEINLSNFPKGVYFVKIDAGIKIYTKRVIVQ
jgi:hypothetical protein